MTTRFSHTAQITSLGWERLKLKLTPLSPLSRHVACTAMWAEFLIVFAAASKAVSCRSSSNRRRAKMRQISSGKAAENERKYPYKVAIAIAGDGLEIGLSRRIMAFHQARHIKPRHGRTAIAREGEAYFRCVFPIWRRRNLSSNSSAE
jgi:hypothetical protein